MKKMKILKLVLLTIIVMVIIFSIITTISVFCFTEGVAKVCYNCGFYNISSKLYAYKYSRSMDTNYIIKSCNISLENNMYENYVQYYEQWIKDVEYLDNIAEMNKNNYENDKLAVIVKSSLINEDNYYKNFYINSLYEIDKPTKAIHIATQDFFANAENNISYTTPASYSLNIVLDNSKDFEWLELKNNNGKSLATLLIAYGQNVRNNFYEINDVLDKDEIYFLNYCRNSLVVINNIIEIDREVNGFINDSDVLDLNKCIIDINNAIASIVENMNE